MTRWLLVSGDFTPLGGMDCANHALASALAGQPGHSVTLVTHRVSADLERTGVAVERVSRPLGSHLLGAPLLGRTGQRLARRLPAGSRIVANGGNMDAGDITWVHYLHAAHVPIVRGVRRRIQARLSNPYDTARERRALTNARVVVCNSRRTADDVARHVGGDATRLRVVYYGTDPEVFSHVGPEARRAARRELGWDTARPVAIVVGALGDRRKGFDRVLEAWQILCGDQAWDVDLAVAGGGSELPGWRRRVVDAGIESRVRFLGYRTDVPRLLAASDLLVHASRYEAYGLGVHEAICRGLPAIVSASAGIAERFPAELWDWLLVNVEDAHELADRVRRWRSDGTGASRVRAFSDQLRARTWRDMATDFVAAVAA
jgi:glycosyltransferase involved in cell wall biosynthesis